MLDYRKSIYSSLIFLSVFTDVIFSRWMGYFGRSLLNLLIPVFLIIYILFNKGIGYNSFIKRMWNLAILLVFVNIISDIMFLIRGNNIVFRGENIFFKSFTQWFYWFEIVIFMAIIYDCISCLDFDSIFRPFVATFFFLFIILVIEWFQLPYAFTNFHFTNDMFSIGGYYERIRLTATESSLSIPLIVSFGFMSLFYFINKEKRIMIMVIVVMLGMFVFTSGSKVIYFCISIAIFTYVRSMKIRSAGMIIGYAMAVIIVIGVVAYEANSFLNMMIATRGSTYTVRTIPDLAALIISIQYPVGLGGAVHYDKIVPVMNKVYKTISSSAVGSLYSYREVVEYMQDESKDVGIIAGYFNYLYQWGIIGGLYWVYAFVDLFRGTKDVVLKGKGILIAGLNCVVFMIMFTMPFSNHYMNWAYIIISGHIILREVEASRGSVIS